MPPPVPVPMSSQAASAVPDFDSHPSDVALVNSYLIPWVVWGIRPPGDFVHVANLYDADPEDFARLHRAAVAADGERAWYFLCSLRTNCKSHLSCERRVSRAVDGGAGCWHSEGSTRPVLDPLDGLRQVGYRQTLYFKRRCADGTLVRAGWIMQELRLHEDEDDDGGGLGGRQLDGLVLCKVYRSPRFPETAAAPDDGGDEESCEAAETAPDGRHSNAADGDGSSDAPLVAVVAPGGKRKADDDDEGSSAATPRRHIKNADGENEFYGAAAAVMAPGINKQAADGENEVYGAATAAARGNEDGKKRAAADGDEDSLASTTARKRARTAGDEDPDAASASALAPALMRKEAVVALPAATQLLVCPQCKSHIGVLQSVVAPATSTSETRTMIAQAGAPQGGGRMGDASGNDHTTHRLHLKFSGPKQA